MNTPYYESDEAIAQYLLLHYGAPAEVMPFPGAAVEAAGFPERCVTATIDAARVPSGARALDLGCAVGRSSFELARFCASVTGIDFSRRFIDAARRLQRGEALEVSIPEQGDLRRQIRVRAPEGIDRDRVQFEQGDAMNLRSGLGVFDVVLLANLLCRLADPRRCLAQLAALVRPGGQLVITTPSTWRQIHTPREHWIGGFERDGRAVRTLDGLQEILGPSFDLSRRIDLPLLIREHARKFEYIVAEATAWFRRPA